MFKYFFESQGVIFLTELKLQIKESVNDLYSTYIRNYLSFFTVLSPYNELSRPRRTLVLLSEEAAHL